MAPVSTRDHICMHMLYQFAASYALGRPVALNIRLPRYAPRGVIELTDLCAKHSALDLYLWLSYRFPKLFIERELCLQQKSHAIAMIEEALNSTTLQQKYDYVKAYQLVHERVRFSTELQGLPPSTFADIRDATKSAIESIPEEFRYVYPNEGRINSKTQDDSYRESYEKKSKKFQKNHNSTASAGKDKASRLDSKKRVRNRTSLNFTGSDPIELNNIPQKKDLIIY